MHGSAAPALVIDTMTIFNVGNATYLALPASEPISITLPSAANSSLVTVVFWPRAGESDAWLRDQTRAWTDVDDVFSSEFLDGLVVVVPDDLNEVDITASIGILSEDSRPRWWATVPAGSHGQLLPGPYLLSKGRLHRAYKVYDDVNGAFVVATNLGSLQSVRFAIKDVFEVEGLRVTAGNRAFYSLSAPATSTCSIIQRLIDAGAELVGTLKLGSLIAREEPTESVDFHAPFNPRADGYQSAWSSSGGSGAAVAAYNWVDFTLGTDTTGSSRRPAMANGVFQIRLTHDRLPLTNVVPSFPRFDSAAMYTRDIASMEKWVGAWLDEEPASYENSSISVVYLTDFLPVSNSDQMVLIDDFIGDLEKVYNVKREKVSIAETWKTSPPKETEDLSVQDYLKDVGVNSFVYDVYHLMDKFRHEFRDKFSCDPYINPVTRFRWDLAKLISGEEHAEAMKRLDIYKDWLLEHILQPSKRNVLLVLPITSQEADYREDPPPQVIPVNLDTLESSSLTTA
ncbi:amidase signature domain-containing protein [Lasiosphaeria ovina]|uniref:Amidase signature domain-containing protein n=1 Tax=Lasiosphaeria ovina TaxID=92902 RepID=A0AAE0KCP4_9PEZI|nr:amidase signature domain-containing protein [Lasiosphaeria ovina]